MRKIINYCFMALIILSSVLVLSCSQNKEPEQCEWTFTNYANHTNYIDVSIYNDGTPSTFRLYENDSKSVTWPRSVRGGFKYTANYYESNYYYYEIYTEELTASQNIVFYDKVVNK